MTLPDPRVTPVLTVEQAALLLGVSRAVAYASARAGSLPGAFKLGSRWVVPTAAILAALHLSDMGEHTDD